VSVADTLRAALESGDFAALGECYAEDAVLDLNVRGGRERVAGPAAIIARLERLFPGAGRLVEWSAALHDLGAAVWVERVSDAEDAVLRQRQYLLLRDGRVRRHFAYTAPHRTGVAGAGGRPSLDPRLIGGLGDIAEHTVLASRGWSGNVLERVVLANGRALIAKRIVPGADWIGRGSADPGREGLLFTNGVLDRLPPAVDHAMVAVARDGDAWWLVMRDVSGELLDDHSIVPREANRRLLAAVNEMWESFWGERIEFLTPQALRLQIAAPSVGRRERDGIDLLPKQLEVMWEAFAEAVQPDVAAVVLALVEDAAPLAAALHARGSTLLHGDIRDEQIGLAGDRLVLLDWGLATQGHPVIDYAWHLMHSAWRIDATHDELWADFRAARGERDDPLAVELGMIAGLTMYGWILGHSAVVHPDPAERTWARKELEWWVPRARQALETWSPSQAS
jgi:ketosteroid isomerase-like protein